MNNWKLRHSFTGNATSDVQTVNGYLASGEDNDFAVTVVPDGKEYAAPLFIPRTNLILQSNQFDTTWLTANCNVTGGQSGYDGSNDAWQLENTGSALSYVRQSSLTVSGLQTLSFYAKAGNVDWLRVNALLSGTNANNYFNIASGTIGASPSPSVISSSITEVATGWYRISLTYNDTASEIRIQIADGDGDENTPLGSYIYIQDAQLETGSVATEYIPTTTAAVTRDWSAFGRVQNQLPGICNGTHTHTGAASGSGIAATTITGSGSGATFAYDFDTLGVLTTLTADGAGSGYKVGDKLSIDTTEGHTIEFRLVDGSNAATVSVSMDATRPNKPIPFPVSKMRVEGLTDRTVLFLDKRSQYVFPKPTPYLLDTYEGAAAAYSLRRLRSAYTGPAVRVRRETNNDELDIYFNRDGSLDTATLEAFCAGTNGFVSVWYDQGQGGNDATQATTSAQPKIYDSSTGVITIDGNPAFSFDGVDDDFDANHADLLNQSRVDYFAHYQTSDNAFIFLAAPPTRFGWVIQDGSTTTALESMSGLPDLYVNGSQVVITAGVTTCDDLHTAVVTNAASATAGALETTLNANTTLWTTFGIFTYTGIYRFSGKLAEAIFYTSDQSANRTGIESNINEHYGIYP